MTGTAWQHLYAGIRCCIETLEAERDELPAASTGQDVG